MPGGHQIPRIAAVATPEQGCWLHAAPQFLPARASLKRPDVRKRAAVYLRKRRCQLRLREALSNVCRTQHLHPEERIVTRGIQTRRAARVDERRVHQTAKTEGVAQREAARRSIVDLYAESVADRACGSRQTCAGGGRQPAGWVLGTRRCRPGFPFCLSRMAPLYTRPPPRARNSVRRTSVQLQRLSLSPR